MLLYSVLTIGLIISSILNIYYKSKTNKYSSSVHSTTISNEILTVEINSKQQTIEEQQQTINEQTETINKLTAELKELKKPKYKTSYPDTEFTQAKYIWSYLTEETNLNKYVAAGILGNIMVEVGGQTLDFSKYSCRESANGKYYGICQWAGPRKERLLSDFGPSLENQLEFLIIELYEIIPADDSFYTLQDEQKVALQFAKQFERCNSRSYYKRQNCASKALKYFNNF
jgi:hypothetical protein